MGPSMGIFVSSFLVGWGQNRRPFRWALGSRLHVAPDNEE